MKYETVESHIIRIKPVVKYWIICSAKDEHEIKKCLTSRKLHTNEVYIAVMRIPK